MRRAEIQRWGDDRLRVRAWRGSSSVALVSPVPGQPPVSVTTIRLTGASLQERGFERAVTSALTPAEERMFVAGGYTVRERLHLLHHDLTGLGTVDIPARLHRARRADTEAILRTDNAAFGEFWKLDSAGLQDAIAATPTARVRTAHVDENEPTKVVGYAVTGRAGSSGYLQRLAVHPSQQGEGIGRDLVVDCLRWVKRRGGTRVLVNTQEANEGALALYTAMGFQPESHGLAVLECELVGQ
jgi:ribosomal protein S18 acetylase RimI-like enzyme